MIKFWSGHQQNVDIISPVWFVTKLETQLEDRGKCELQSQVRVWALDPRMPEHREGSDWACQGVRNTWARAIA